MLTFAGAAFDEMVAHAYRCYPEEACGLLAGDPAAGSVEQFYPCVNSTRSGRVYTIEPRDHLLAERDAESHGMEILGVFHSHTHTEPYPSPTDVAQAPDADWHYVIVSLKRERPESRSYRIVDGGISEEAVVVRPQQAEPAEQA